MAEIDGEEHPAGDRVARVGADLDKADRGAGIGRVGVADPVDRVDHPRRADQRVLAPRHRRRPGMRLLAGDGDLVPALALRAGDDADRVAGRFEDRPLLDMRLEIGGDRVPADRLWPGKADAFEFGAERQLGRVVVARRQRRPPARTRRRTPPSRPSPAKTASPPRWSRRRSRWAPRSRSRDRSRCARFRARPSPHRRRRTCRRSAGCRDGCRSSPAAGPGCGPAGGQRCCRSGRL